MSDEKMMPTDVERVAAIMASEIRRITGYVLSATTSRVVAEAALAHPPQARDVVQRLAEAVKLAIGWFDEYAAMHRAKGTDEGHSKAQRNQDRADELRQALAALPPVPADVADIRARCETAPDTKRALLVIEQWGEIVHAAWHMLDDQEQTQQDPKLLQAMTDYDDDYEIHDLYREDKRLITQLIENAQTSNATLTAECERLRADEREACAKVAEQALGGYLCPYGRDKPGDKTWGHTDKDLCPVCRANGQDALFKCHDTASGRIAAAIRARALQPAAAKEKS